MTAIMQLQAELDEIRKRKTIAIQNQEFELAAALHDREKQILVLMSDLQTPMQ